jgi:protein involved in polysaccharide export with SLBB domain
MKSLLYSLRKKFQNTLSFQIAIFALVLNVIIFPAWGQAQRRGIFLQDPVAGPENLPLGESGLEEDDYLGGGRSVRGRNAMDQTGLDRGGLIYQVHVLGEVKRPGTYRVSPSMRVTDALQIAGNLKPMGSERFIELRKQGSLHGRVLDLFAYKTLGDLSQNPYLQDNETIFVPLKKRAVEVEGPVRRPGVFELKNEDNLNDIVELAGGFTVGVNPQEPIKIVRYGGNEEKEIISISQDSESLRSFDVQDGDVIFIPHKFLTKHQFDYNIKRLPNDNIFYPSYENRVFVIGAVRLPGPLDFNQNYTLRQYLTLAGGTTTMAKNGQIKVVTNDGRTIKAKNGNYDGVINPGDTIVVPEKSIPTAFYIGLLPTIASLGLSATALFK